MTQIFYLAQREMVLGRRNRLVFWIGFSMTLLALVLAYFGSVQNGGVGLSGFDSTIVSLTSLSLYLVPILGLILGYDSMVGEIEGKTLELLFTMPVHRAEIFFGKFLGLGAMMVLSMTVGFVFAGGVIGWFTGWDEIFSYLFFILAVNLLGLVFLSIALLISTVVRGKAQALGTMIFCWFFFVMVFDFILVGVLVLSEGQLPKELLNYILFLNPSDVFRLAATSSIEKIRNAYGLATLASQEIFSLPVLFLMLTLWVGLPLGLGSFVFQRRRI